MEGITLRPLEPGDMEQLEELLRTRDELDEEGARIRTRLHEWIAFHNPAANGRPTYYVAEDKGRIIAYHGRMPTEFVIAGQVVPAYYVNDLYVHPENRRKGQGFWLTMALAREIEKESDAFFCLIGMSPLNLRMQRRFGYTEIKVQMFTRFLSGAKVVARIVKVKPLVKLLTPLTRLGLRLIDAVLFMLTTSSGVQTEEVERFDESVDGFCAKHLSRFSICTQKSSALLNWKYVDIPHREDICFVARRGGEVSGVMVLANSPNVERRKGNILEITCDPEDERTMSALYKQAMRYFRRTGAESIGCMLTDPRYIRILKRLLFFKTGEKSVLIGNLDKHEPLRHRIVDPAQWHFTGGESDGLMLSPSRREES